MRSVPCASGIFSLEKFSGPLLQVSAQGKGWADRLPVLVGAWLGGRGGGERVEGATRRGQPRGWTFLREYLTYWFPKSSSWSHGGDW